MYQKKIGLACAAFTCMLLGVCFLANTDSASGQVKGSFKAGVKAGIPIAKLDKVKLRLIINKTDPEIKAAQKALQLARTDLLKARTAISKAMSDEVFGEKGPTEGAAIDRLKQSLAACNNALADVNIAIQRANLAQLVDKGGD